MRYYLDTNILVYALTCKEELSGSVTNLLSDYDNIFYTSSICIMELIHLAQTGKIRPNKNALYNLDKLIDLLNDKVTIVPVEERHLRCMSHLSRITNHNDPCDRIIIAQSISDKIPLISSDLKFEQYRAQGLDLVFNKK